MPVHAILSGGIGSGKTTAASVFSDLGAHVISADHAGHQVLEPGGAAHDDVAATWPEVVSEDGHIDRPALAVVVFGDPAALALLESFTHPAIAAVVEREIAELEGDPPLVLVEVPLLISIVGEGWPRIVVDAPDETRRARLRARDMDDADIERRMAAQPGRAEWLASADHVLDNGGDLATLAGEVERVWKALLDS